MSATHRLSLCAVLTALALALSYIERFFPLILLIPLPGVKLGLANVVTLFALLTLDSRAAVSILLCRCFLGAMFAGNASALLFSLLGGCLAMAVMLLLKRGRRFSVYGISLAGAAAHNVGQVLAAMLTLGTQAPLYYLPPLLLVAVCTGALNGFLVSLLLRALRLGRA